MRYQEYQDNPNPLSSAWFWVIIFLAWIDLTITFTGLRFDIGSEANPFFAWFVQNGALFMVLGVGIYSLILLFWFRNVPPVLRAVSVGVLVAAHTWGIFSWAQHWFPVLDIFFGPFALIVGPPLVGSVLTIWAFIDPETLLPRQDRITWVDYL